MLTEVAIAVMAELVMLFRAAVTTMVNAVVVGLLLLLGAYWWSSYNAGILSRGNLHELGLSLK